MRTTSEAETILASHPDLEHVNWSSVRCACGAPNSDLFISAPSDRPRARRDHTIDLIRTIYCTNCSRELPGILDDMSPNMGLAEGIGDPTMMSPHGGQIRALLAACFDLTDLVKREVIDPFSDVVFNDHAVARLAKVKEQLDALIELESRVPDFDQNPQGDILPFSDRGKAFAAEHPNATVEDIKAAGYTFPPVTGANDPDLLCNPLRAGNDRGWFGLRWLERSFDEGDRIKMAKLTGFTVEGESGDEY